MMNRSNTPVIELKGISTFLANRWIHRHINLSIFPGEILALVGGSGAGKTTLLREILQLHTPTEGTIYGFENPLDTPNAQLQFRLRTGVMFQQGALFSSLSVLENVAFPLKEHTQLDAARIEKIAKLKIAMVGFPMTSIHQLPASLSGGMQKRAAIARALAMDPDVLFLDEPTAGLDPQGASGLDELILTLRDALGLTIVMVTHDVDTLIRTTNRVAFLGEGTLLDVDKMDNLINSKHPLIHTYFSGPRGRAARHLV